MHEATNSQSQPHNNACMHHITKIDPIRPINSSHLVDGQGRQHELEGNAELFEVQRAVTAI